MFSRDIDIDYNIVLKNRIPLLIRDENWIKLFGDIKDRDIISCRKELEDLLQEQKNVNRELNSLKAKKKKLMDKILEVSYEVNNNKNESYINLLEDFQKEILAINEEIDDLTFKDEMLPKKIREANYKLLKETVKYAYRELKENQDEYNYIVQQIDKLRDELRNLLEKKHDHEERINATYSFLHGILGNEEMEKLDKIMY